MKCAHLDDEYLDLVDENDNVVGKKKRSEIYAQGLSNFRVVNAFIVNKKGELWIPRRAPGKRVFPNCLDASMGGHVESGETYKDAFRRELREELDLDVDEVSYRLLGYLTPKNNKISAFMEVYEIKMDEAPQYNNNDFTEYFWLTPESLIRRIEQGDRAKEDLPKIVNILRGSFSSSNIC